MNKRQEENCTQHMNIDQEENLTQYMNNDCVIFFCVLWMSDVTNNITDATDFLLSFSVLLRTILIVKTRTIVIVLLLILTTRVVNVTRRVVFTLPILFPGIKARTLVTMATDSIPNVIDNVGSRQSSS